MTYFWLKIGIVLFVSLIVGFFDTVAKRMKVK